MQEKEAIFRQSELIDGFNKFARLAKEFLSIDIARLNDNGCCYALAQYYLKHAREGTLNEFYKHIGYINSRFSDENIVHLLKRAKPTLTPEQEEAKKNKIPSPDQIRYNNFEIEGETDYSFNDLMNFAEGISKAQAGYISEIAKGRYATKIGQFHKGKFEKIAGNWDNSFPIYGNKKAIQQALEKMHFADNRYAMICSGNHAIAFRRTANNFFIVYDSNDPYKQRIVKHLTFSCDDFPIDDCCSWLDFHQLIV